MDIYVKAKSSDWTTADKDMLIEMWEAGKTAFDIGMMLGRSRSAVLGQVDRMRSKGFTFAARSNSGSLRSLMRPKRSPKPRFKPSVTQRPKPRIVPSITDAQAYDAAAVGLTLEELKANDCRYIVDGDGADASFCGHHARGTYCDHHQARCFYTPKEGVTGFLARITGHNSRNGAFK